MRSLRLRILRLTLVACLGLGAALPAGAGAAGPPYSDGSIPDGVVACSGSPYDHVERDGDLYVRCWDASSGGEWRVFTTAASLSGTTATITLSRANARGRALIAFETRPGTASPGVDYLDTSGRVYFGEDDTTGSVTVPLPPIAPPPGTPTRSFSVVFDDVVDLGLTVPAATVELPAVGTSPDPGYPDGPPYTPAGRLDGDIACDGGLFDIIVRNRNNYVRCLGGVQDAHRFSAATSVSGSTATLTVTRASGAGTPSLVGFATEPDTAVAGADYTAMTGELFFAEGVTARTLSIPVVRDPQATVDKRFAVRLSALIGQGQSVPSDVTVTILGPPEPPTIASGPTGSTVMSTASFGFSGGSGATFECRLDDAAFAPCTSPRALTKLPAGEHRFEVRQQVAGGPWSAPAVREWTVLPSPDPGYPIGPPYAGSTRPIDADYYCDGGFYSLPTHNGDRYLWCLGSSGNPWQQLSPDIVVGEDTATITISRPEGWVPIVVGFATEADTAVAGRDFTATQGELYFAENVTTRTLTIPIVRDPAAGEPRRFSLKLSEPVRQGLGLPTIDVTIPGHPPTASTAPVVGGTPRVGHELTSTDGEWTHEPTGFGRSWERCDAAGAGCVAIDGADGASYEPVAADVGARLRVAVTASNGSGSDVARSAPTAVIRQAIEAPTITAGPSGTQLLHRAAFGFTGESGATFECRLDGGAYAPCTSPRTLTQLPSGERRFEVRQRATDGALSEAAVREWTVLSSPDPGYPTAPPYGFPIDAFSSCRGGEFNLVVHNNDRWARCAGDPGALAWQRFAADVEVVGTTATLTVTREGDGGPALVGFAMSDGTAVAGRDYVASSGELYFASDVTSRTLPIPVVPDPTASSDRRFSVTLSQPVAINLRLPEPVVATIPGNPPTATDAPAIGGVARVDATLTATDGAWTHEPTGFARSWERCDPTGNDCQPIAGATDADYDPVVADLGSRLRFVVAATNGSGTTTERSAPSAVVRAVLAAPAVAGGPAGTTAPASATFSFTGEAGATFECRREDGGEYAACAPPVTLTGLGPGEHVLAVRQVADDGVVSPETVRRWTVVAPVDPQDPDTGGQDPPGPGTGNGQGPGAGPGPGLEPPLPPVPVAPPLPVSPRPLAPRQPVRMATVRLELRFCRGCTTLSARDRKRLQRLRGRVDGSRLLAIDGYGDRGRSRAANRKLARARARAVERALMSGVRTKPARRAVVAHDRLVRAAGTSAASDTKRGGRPVERIVTVRVVNRR